MLKPEDHWVPKRNCSHYPEEKASSEITRVEGILLWGLGQKRDGIVDELGGMDRGNRI